MTKTVCLIGRPDDNMKNKKGFTLVELLAVIVILAILATAAFTLVLPQIEKSRKKSFVSEVASIIDSAELYFLEHPTEESVKIEDLKPYIKNYDSSKVGCVLAPTSTNNNYQIRFSNGDYKTNGTEFYEIGDLKTTSGAATSIVVKIDDNHSNFTDGCTLYTNNTSDTNANPADTNTTNTNTTDTGTTNTDSASQDGSANSNNGGSSSNIEINMPELAEKLRIALQNCIDDLIVNNNVDARSEECTSNKLYSKGYLDWNSYFDYSKTIHQYGYIWGWTIGNEKTNYQISNVTYKKNCLIVDC